MIKEINKPSVEKFYLAYNNNKVHYSYGKVGTSQVVTTALDNLEEFLNIEDLINRLEYLDFEYQIENIEYIFDV